VKLVILANFFGWGVFSERALPVESDRSRTRVAGKSKDGVGVFDLADRATTNAGPKFGVSVESYCSVLILLLRSEERLVTVTGILFKILFAGVSYPIVLFEGSPCRGGRTGVMRDDILVVFACSGLIVFAVGLVWSRRVAPEVPIMVALKSEVVCGG
jgi:hypothetical protein